MRTSTLQYQSASFAENSSPALSRPRWIALDLLRACAILLVLYGHVNFRMPDNTIGLRLFYILRQMGLIGVDLFLVLSGFFTALFFFSHSQAHAEELPIKNFFARRIWKLWPSYFLAVLIAIAWQWLRVHGGGSVIGRTTATLADTWQYFTHIQNYSEPKAGYFQQTWTMALIIHFYLAFVLILLLLRTIGDGKNGKPFRAIPWLFLGVAAMCFYFRYRAAYALDKNGKVVDYDAWLHYFPTHLRIDEIMAGVLIAYVAVYARGLLDRIARYWPVVVVLSLACMAPVALRPDESPRFLYIWGYTLAGLGCAGLTLLAAAASFKPRTAPASRPARAVAFIGASSYSIYIWHQPFAQWLGGRIGNKVCSILHLWGTRVQYPMLVAVYMTIAIASGVLMYFLVERTALKFRDRLRRAGTRPKSPRLEMAPTATSTIDRRVVAG